MSSSAAVRSDAARLLSQSPLENKRLNLIPVGRQLQRTPPTKSTNTQPSEDPAAEHEEHSQDGILGGQDDAMRPSATDDRTSYRRSSLTPASAKMGNADPEAFIQGMQGYRWTDADLEFVYQAKQQKRAQQLQLELCEVEKTLQAETQRLELAVASRDQLQSELSKTPSCDSLLQLCKSVLSRSLTSEQLDGLGDKALLSLLNLQDVQGAVREANAEIGRLQRKATKAQEQRDKQEKAMKEMDNCQKKISALQANISALKVELAELKTQLSEKEASKAARVRREIRKAAKAQAISDALKTPEEKEPEETNTSQASLVSQVPAKGRKGPRRVKPLTKGLKETPEKETAPKDKAGKNTADNGKTAPAEKAPENTTSKKTARKEMTPNEMPLQVKSPVEMETQKIPPKVKLVKFAEVLEKGHKGSRTAKTSTMVQKDKAQKKTALNKLAENEMVPVETADKEMAQKGKKGPKVKTPRNTTSKKTAEKELSPDETTSQVKTLVETALEKTAPETKDPKIKSSNVAQVMEKGRKGSRTAKTSTTVKKDKSQKKTVRKESTETEMVPMETADKDMAYHSQPSPEIKTPKMTTLKKTSKKEFTTDERAPEEIAPVVLAPEELPLKVKALYVAQALEKGCKGSRMAKPSTTALKEQALKSTALRETVEKETAPLDVDKKAKTVRKVRAPRKATLKNTAEKEMAQEETSLEEPARKVKASRLKAPMKTASKKTADMEMPLAMTVEEVTVTKKLTSKVRAPKKTTSKKTDLKVTAVHEMAEDENALKETVSKKALKEASKKVTVVKDKVKQESDPEEIASESMALKEVDEEATSTKTTQKKTASKVKAPNVKPEKETALKEMTRRTSKEKVPKQKVGRNPSEDEDAVQAPRRAQKAAKPPESSLQSDHETIRRSKRNTVKDPSLSKTIPEKTTRSRQR